MKRNAGNPKMKGLKPLKELSLCFCKLFLIFLFSLDEQRYFWRKIILITSKIRYDQKRWFQIFFPIISGYKGRNFREFRELGVFLRKCDPAKWNSRGSSRKLVLSRKFLLENLLSFFYTVKMIIYAIMYNVSNLFQ